MYRKYGMSEGDITDVANKIRDELCPTGFKWMTNISYGNEISISSGRGISCTEHYVEFLEKIKKKGYIVQVAEPVDNFGRTFTTPLYQALAVYVRKEDNGEVNPNGECFK